MSLHPEDFILACISVHTPSPSFTLPPFHLCWTCLPSPHEAHGHSRNRLLVASHLGAPYLNSTRHALASCVRVCWNWHETFIPLLYSDINPVEFSVDISGLTIGLNRHGHHITELSVILPYPFLDTSATTTSNIEDLTIHNAVTSDMNQGIFGDQHGLWTLLSKSSEIEILHIDNVTAPNSSRSIDYPVLSEAKDARSGVISF